MSTIAGAGESSSVRETLERSLSGSYEIQHELTGGGMSRVFLARDVKFERAVVVKALDRERGLDISAQRFAREIALAAGLQQANIVPVFGAGDADGVPYYVMPFVEGESLRSHMRSGERMPVARALEILRDMSRALEYAHVKGIVHRDIKPENVLLSGGTAVVTDFGIGKAIDAARNTSGAEAITQLTRQGLSIGTPGYMAPEQIIGADADARADVYAWGVVAWELLAGRPPFAASTLQQQLAAHMTEVPSALASINPEVPPKLSELVARCLAKDPSARPRAGAALAAELQSIGAERSTSLSFASPSTWSRGVKFAAVVAVIVLTATAAYGSRLRRVDRARSEFIPAIEQLRSAGQFDSALTLLRESQAILGTDTTLSRLEGSITQRITIRSEPSGARVYRQRGTGADTSWFLTGTTPLDSVPVARGRARYRIEQSGYRPYYAGAQRNFVAILHKQSDTMSTEMVRVAGRDLVPTSYPISQRYLTGVSLSTFQIGRFEVTNREFKRFVDAGGYRDMQWWTDSVRRNGRVLSTDEVIATLVDRTGQPAPSTWSVAAPADAELDHPVKGVSWYEARAYARWAGVVLPTFYHWSAAADLTASPAIIARSNFSKQSSSPVGRYRGITAAGAFDMAGNVREWLSNAYGESRLTAGGAWNDLTYMFLYTTPVDPLDRSAVNGFRVARFEDDAANATLAAAIPNEVRDFRRERPVGDEAFALYRRQFTLDSTPSSSEMQRDSTPDYRNVRLAMKTGLTEDSLLIELFLPTKVAPPYQLVTLVPGSGQIRSGELAPAGFTDEVLDFVRSGRAVMVPVLSALWQRPGAAIDDRTSMAYRDRVVTWGKEYRIALEHVRKRADIDSGKVAYYGLSMGSRLMPIMYTAAPLFHVAVLNCPGIPTTADAQEIDILHYLPRVRIPALMVSGRLDMVFPYEQSQLPYLRHLGTSEAQRKFVLLPDVAHCPSTDAFLREALPWLDRWLGKVGTTR